VESDGADVDGGGDSTKLGAVLSACIVSELLVELAREPAPPMVWPDSDEVQIPKVRPGWDGETKATMNPANPCSSSATRLVDQKWSRKSRGSEALTGRPHHSSITITMRS